MISDHWIDQAKGFSRSARHDINDHDWRLAAFHIHQMVELCYTAIHILFTHNNPQTHSLFKLRFYAVSFDDQLKSVFSCETTKQMQLFEHLDCAYIGSRYCSRQEFMITKEQVNYWFPEAQKLLELTEIICREQIERSKLISQA